VTSWLAGDPCTLSIWVTDGAIIMSKISKTFILTFSTQFQRGRFVSETRARMDKLTPAHEYIVEGNWREPLPIHTYERFEAFKLKKGRYQVVLMALVPKRKVYVLRCKDIADYEAGCAIPGGVRALLLQMPGRMTNIYIYYLRVRTCRWWQRKCFP
jgi:hypothetical protein